MTNDERHEAEETARPEMLVPQAPGETARVQPLVYALPAGEAVWPIGLRLLITLAGISGAAGIWQSLAFAYLLIRYGDEWSRLLLPPGTSLNWLIPLVLCIEAVAGALLLAGAVAFAARKQRSRILLIAGAAGAVTASVAEAGMGLLWFSAFSELVPIITSLPGRIGSLGDSLAVPLVLLYVLTRRQVGAHLANRAHEHQ